MVQQQAAAGKADQAGADVIIVGAGIAGLAAGRTLAESGLRVLILEATDRIGGRLLTVPSPGTHAPVELGAEFIHGRPLDLLALIQEAGLHLQEVEGTHYCYEDGRLQPCPENSAFDVLDELKNYQGADQDFATYLREHPKDAETAAQAASYVEGFNAADASKISILALAAQQRAEDAIEGDRAFRIIEGYSALADYLRQKFEDAGGAIRFGAKVRSVTWRSGHVAFRLQEEWLPVIAAPHAIVTLPLGVLQSGSVTFSPVPASFAGLAGLCMGSVLRLVLVFKPDFWALRQNELPSLSFLFAADRIPSVFWARADEPMLTAWVGGTRTASIPPDAFLSTTLRMLQILFKVTFAELEDNLVSSHFHDWNADPFGAGAYSYVQAGGIEMSTTLSIANEDPLIFAGEHTDTTGHWGTVHGALRSGLRAAAQLLSAARRDVDAAWLGEVGDARADLADD